MQFLLVLILVLVLGSILYLFHPRFGARMEGDRLTRMKSKSNYTEGAFENLEPTPALKEGSSSVDIWKYFFFARADLKKPKNPLPVDRVDLHDLPRTQNAFVWFGHSSYYLQLDGKRILVDPVFSKYATPVRVSIRAFEREYEHQVSDLPDIDILVITHDHWDHLDYNTFMKIKDRVGHIVTGLGVGAHLEKWGFPAERISELYWGESAEIEGLRFHSHTARHFSGRTFKRNVTLWSSYVLEGSKKIYIGGDSGYGTHFKEIGDRFGSIDFAFLENGQYNELWRYIHMMPEEVPLAGKDLRARYLIPVHSAKFPLANHAWDEPLKRVYQAAKEQNVHLLTPRLGQLMDMDESITTLPWWEGLE